MLHSSAITLLKHSALWYARGVFDERQRRGEPVIYDHGGRFADHYESMCLAFSAGELSALPSVQDAWRHFEEALRLGSFD